jgi:hypothetical protein
MSLPESREARYSLRGKPTTSWWKAQKVADQTLVVRKVAPRPPKTQEELDKLNEEIFGRNWKPQVPMIYAMLDMKPFQSREQFLETLETGYVKPEATSKTVTSPRASDMRQMEFSKLLDAFDDI